MENSSNGNGAKDADINAEPDEKMDDLTIVIPGKIEEYDSLEEHPSPLRRKDYNLNCLMNANQEKAGLRMFFPIAVWWEIWAYAAGNTEFEIAGDVFGDIYKDADGPYIEVKGHIPSLHMTATWASAADTIKNKQFYLDEKARVFPGMKTVAWYHTHPDLGVFLSPQDKKTKQIAYPLWYQVAIVIDPVRGEAVFYYGQKQELKQVLQVYLYWKQTALFPKVTVKGEGTGNV